MKLFLEAFLKFRKTKSLLDSIPKRIGITKKKPLDKKSRIVIIGGGIAGISFAEQARHQGFEDITLISAEKNFGGRCVNQGCMPFEYFWTTGKNPKKFIQDLGKLIEKKVNGLAVKVLYETAEKVVENSVHLSSGKTVSFDFLAIAAGSKQFQSEYHLKSKISLEDFWSLPLVGKKILVLSDGSETGWSIAATLRKLNADVLLLNQNSDLTLSRTDSFKYFQKQIENKGVVVGDIHRIHHLEENRIQASTSAGFFDTEYDHLVEWSQNQTKKFLIDGKNLQLSDAAFSASTFYLRSNIVLLGEAGAALSAAESESDAFAAALALMNDPKSFEWHQQPLRIHAEQSWAYCGDFTEVFDDCDYLDFNELGWNGIQYDSGRIWYRYHAGTDRITSIHIVHSQAGALINLAALLLEFPVQSRHWLAGSIHPSGAEIFKKIAMKITGEIHGNH